MENEFDQLNQSLRKITAQRDEYFEKLQNSENDLNNLLRFSGIAIIDTSLELRIIHSNGAIEEVFQDNAPKVKHGENLMILVYKTTNNIKSLDEEGILDKQEREDVEVIVNRFLQSPKTEKEIKIVGETLDGEAFLLIWNLVKLNKKVRSYFKIIPTNALVESVKEKFKKRLDYSKENLKLIMDNMNEGITILTLKGIVEYMNKKAQSHFLGDDSIVKTQANMVGKYFNKLFPHEDAEETKKFQFFMNKIFVTKEEQRFTKMIHERPVDLTICPLIDENENIHSIALISSQRSLDTYTNINTQHESGKLIRTIKSLADDKKVIEERLKELNSNQDWLMKKRREDAQTIKQFHLTIKQIYTYLESIPLPLSIHALPSQRFEFINKALEEKLNLGRADVLGKTIGDIFSKTVTQTLLSKVREHLSDTEIFEIEGKNLKTLQRIIMMDDKTTKFLVRIYLELFVV